MIQERVWAVKGTKLKVITASGYLMSRYCLHYRYTKADPGGSLLLQTWSGGLKLVLGDHSRL